MRAPRSGMMASHIKTSITDPLQIAVVTPPGIAGSIGMTLCPGRKSASSASGGSWNRDLNIDLEIIRTWKPSLVLTLMEEHEFKDQGVPDFRRQVTASGLPWTFAPIKDGYAPDDRFAADWEKLGPRVRNMLRRGGRILIHCRAGLERTGTIAALILIEFGMSPQDAIDAVRRARGPHAIYPPTQEPWVRERKPLPPRCSRNSAIAGSLYGAAAGDALGSAFEMLDASQIERYLGEPFAWKYHAPVAGSLLSGQKRAAGWPTDDTAMALSVAGVIAAGNDFSANRFATAFLTDLDQKTGRFGKMFWRGAPGIATMKALARLNGGASPETSANVNDGGNGTAMRAHPVGFLTDQTRVLIVAANQAKVTHGHPAAIAAAQAVAVLVHDALLGIEPTLDPPHGIDNHEFTAAWHKAHQAIERGAKRLPAHLLSVEMSAWATVAAAGAIAFIYQDDPKRAIAAAAASGGDTDTIASIVGGIVGARCGVEALDPKWLAGLKGSDDVRRAVDLLTGSDLARAS
jgi:ADP-ribosyl-[dinitrogen reductase] hydrolase